MGYVQKPLFNEKDHKKHRTSVKEHKNLFIEPIFEIFIDRIFSSGKSALYMNRFERYKSNGG